MGLTTWKDAPDGKVLKRDIGIAKNYLNEKELFRLNRLVTMFIDYAELMAEDEILMSMQDWVEQTNQFLVNNRREVLDGKGKISHEAAMKKAEQEYEVFRVKQDKEYISEFDREVEKYLKGKLYYIIVKQKIKRSLFVICWFIREAYKNGINFKSILWGKR